MSQLQGLPGFGADQMPLEARILVVADIFDAHAANRPYRDALPLDEVYKIMRKDAPHATDAKCLEALEFSGAGSNQTDVDLKTLRQRLQNSTAPRLLERNVKNI